MQTNNESAKLAFLATISSIDDINRPEEDETSNMWELRTALMWLYHRPARQKKIFEDLHSEHNCPVGLLLANCRSQLRAIFPNVQLDLGIKIVERVINALAYMGSVIVESEATLFEDENLMIDSTRSLILAEKIATIYREWFILIYQRDHFPKTKTLKQTLFINEKIENREVFNPEEVATFLVSP